MSGLKSAWELSLEKTEKVLSASEKNLTPEQKAEIAGIRKEFKAKIADKEITLQHQTSRLGERVQPERVAAEGAAMKKKFNEEKQALEQEMATRIDAAHKRT